MWISNRSRHPENVGVYIGLDLVDINYRTHGDGLLNEVLHLDPAGLVIHGDGTYLMTDAVVASGA